MSKVQHQRSKTNMVLKTNLLNPLTTSSKKISLANKSVSYFSKDEFNEATTLGVSTPFINDSNQILDSPHRKSTKLIENKPKINRFVILESLNTEDKLKKLNTYQRQDTMADNPNFNKRFDKMHSLSTTNKIRNRSQNYEDDNWWIQFSQLEIDLSNRIQLLSDTDPNYCSNSYKLYSDVFKRVIEINKDSGSILKRIFDGYEKIFHKCASDHNKDIKQIEEMLCKEIADNKKLQTRVDAIVNDNRNLLKALSVRNEELSSFKNRNKHINIDEIEKIINEHKQTSSALAVAQQEIRFMRVKENRYLKILKTVELQGYSLKDIPSEWLSNISTDIEQSQTNKLEITNYKIDVPLPSDVSLNLSDTYSRHMSFDVSSIPPTSNERQGWAIKYL